MGMEEALTYVVAVAVPIWLAVEQIAIRRRAARKTQHDAAAAARRAEPVVKQGKPAMGSVPIARPLPPRAA